MWILLEEWLDRMLLVLALLCFTIALAGFLVAAVALVIMVSL